MCDNGNDNDNENDSVDDRNNNNTNTKLIRGYFTNKIKRSLISVSLIYNYLNIPGLELLTVSIDTDPETMLKLTITIRSKAIIY